jgi:hypothetical protein
MKRTMMIGLAAMAAASAFSYDATKDFKSFLMRTMPKVEKAFLKGDTTFFDKISTDDFTDTEMGQTMNKKQSMAQMKQGMAMMKPSVCDLKLLSCSVKGGVGMAQTMMHMVATMMPMKKGDKAHKMVMDMWENETWVKSGSGWKIQKIAQAKPMKMTMDGKPADPSKMGG